MYYTIFRPFRHCRAGKIVLDYYCGFVYTFLRQANSTRIWRNRQTRQLEGLVGATSCKFKSCYPHQNGSRELIAHGFFFACEAVDPARVTGIIKSGKDRDAAKAARRFIQT